jgi:PhzF family phenazine biosynthesis protein
MDIYTVDAFTDVAFGGNPAGVAIFADALPEEAEMLATAKKVGYSETAFLRQIDEGSFELRFFTPVDEVPLCGHATVGTFTLLLKRGMIAEGREYTALTGAGKISVGVKNGLVWLDMSAPKPLVYLSKDDTAALLDMFALPSGACGSLAPAISDAGLADIMLPLRSRELLAAMKPDLKRISGLSDRLNVTGVHACAFGEGAAGYCRNFAPLYGIDEEAATGTSNGALTYYLYKNSLVAPGAQNLFVQGEAMGKPSKIYSTLSENADGSVSIRVGGSGVVRE